jgi:hypothetical protein
MNRRDPGRPAAAAAWLEADRRLRGATDRHEAEPAAAPRAPIERQPPSRPARSGDYFCRHCGTTASGPEPPTGWYRIQQRDPKQRYSSRVFQTLGLFCTTACLASEAAEWAAATAQGDAQ